MKTNAGVIAVTVIALFLGVLAVTQIQAQEVYSRSLQLETPASLTTLIANLSERNNAIREETLDLRHRTETARDAIASGKGSLTEGERQLSQLRVFAGMSAASGTGTPCGSMDRSTTRALGSGERAAQRRCGGDRGQHSSGRTADVFRRDGRSRDHGGFGHGAWSVAGARDRLARGDVHRDDADRRDHRSVRAHLQRDPVRREPRVGARSAGTCDTASITVASDSLECPVAHRSRRRKDRFVYLRRVTLRKPHPASSTRVSLLLGADIGVRCTTCEHRVLVPRSSLERDIKRFVSRGPLAPTD